MKLFVPTLALVASLLATAADGCLVLQGSVSNAGDILVTLNDNGINVCSYWGPLTGGQQWMFCQAGFASWFQLAPRSAQNTGQGVCAYSTGHGAHNYRFNVNSRLEFNNGDWDAYPEGSMQWILSARNYC